MHSSRHRARGPSRRLIGVLSLFTYLQSPPPWPVPPRGGDNYRATSTLTTCKQAIYPGCERPARQLVGHGNETREGPTREAPVEPTRGPANPSCNQCGCQHPGGLRGRLNGTHQGEYAPRPPAAEACGSILLWVPPPRLDTAEAVDLSYA